MGVSLAVGILFAVQVRCVRTCVCVSHVCTHMLACVCVCVRVRVSVGVGGIVRVWVSMFV